jgi:hypothetical protein
MYSWTADLDAFLLPARGEGTALASKPVADKKLFEVAREAVTSGIVPRPSVATLIERGSGEGSPADEADLLLIVGSRDEGVLALNRSAQAQMACETALTIIPGATHLFEEPGTLAAAAYAARDWFVSHFEPDARAVALAVAGGREAER